MSDCVKIPLPFFYEDLLTSLQDGILVVDNDLKIILFNQAMEEISGISSLQAIGKPLTQALRFNPYINNLIIESLRTGKAYYDLKCEFYKGGAISPFIISLIVAPFINRDGDIKGSIASIRDINRLKEIEKDDQMAERLSSIRELAAGMAHEIKNPLSGIKGAAQLLRYELSDDRLKEYTDIIIKEIERVNEIVEGLMNLTRVRSPMFELVNIYPIIDEIITLEKGTRKGKGIIFHRYYDTSIPPIMADSDRLSQLFLNLIRNAVESVSKDGEIIITTKVFSDYLLGNRDKKSSRTILVEIKDNGPGIDKEIMNKLFTPFVTTKKRGSGLGLIISHRIVEEHKGRIKVVSGEAQKGTTIQVFLPITHL
ncbi:MAG: PAS domain S-box protein [Nitrospinae bacterium]|nr:PAS domain S-box protein [Nitrospinota bacterium]